MAAIDERKMTGEVEDLSRAQVEEQQEPGQQEQQSQGERDQREEQNQGLVQDTRPDQDESTRDEKLKKLGTFCHSLGLQPTRLTDKMLNTIEMSKDIERDQRTVISKLNSAASLGPRDEEENDDDDDVENPDEDDDGDTSIVQVDENNEINGGKTKKIAELNSSSKSLRRKKIPPPLSIRNSTEGTMCTNSPNSSATSQSNNYALYPQSAPAHVPNFPRPVAALQNKTAFVGKPRVQYLGKVANGTSKHQQNGYKLTTPFVPYFPRPPPPSNQQLQQQHFQQQQPPPLHPHPQAHPAVSAHYPYFPYMYPMYQPPAYGPPAVARSAMPYSPQAHYYQENESHKRRYKQPQNATKRVKLPLEKADEKLRENTNKKISETDKKRANDVDGGTEPNENGIADVDGPSRIAIEDPTDAEVVEEQPNPVVGEIRILTNAFSFEFPVNGPNIDKKMFLSICNSVWDKSEDLTKNNRQS